MHDKITSFGGILFSEYNKEFGKLIWYWKFSMIFYFKKMLSRAIILMLVFSLLYSYYTMINPRYPQLIYYSNEVIAKIKGLLQGLNNLF